MKSEVYQCEAYNNTPRSAAENFVRTHWREPRKIGKWTPVDAQRAEFKLTDGVFTYEVSLRRGERLVSNDVYVIERRED